ncbi:spore germination protein [Gracilibacillus caseinilyticus]|uniref:Spore germination protein n=1 Tax=Gracilibacillus caseinilyticus TaxID=2932256 RepID=A0ABY4EY56_9BACI|nr:GerAB/ArcD/ProY family transporter [Gracilibacillus caseinilyticus]UOQ49343.1 spore germination protein [Gracilibacillus caseinilyticus]
MNKISNIQLFALIVAFEVGSTTLFAIGIGAKQDAWIVILTAYAISFILIWTYTELPKYYAFENFSEILNDVLGKVMAKPLLLLFGLYFYNQANHNFYEFGALIKLTALPKTPIMVIFYLYIFVIIYILCLGVEVFVRTVEIFFPYLLLFLITVFVFNLFSGEFEFSNLEPVLGEGVLPVLKELPIVIAFPFGEMVVFLMMWHLVEKKENIRKTAFLAVATSTILLLTSTLVIICVLGAELAKVTQIPLLETLLSIKVAMIITNLDSIGVFIMFIGGFYKTAMHFLAFSLAITWLFNKHNPKFVIIISGLLFPIYTIMHFNSIDDQRWKGMEGGGYVILIYALLPFLLLVISILKKKISQRKGD